MCCESLSRPTKKMSSAVTTAYTPKSEIIFLDTDEISVVVVCKYFNLLTSKKITCYFYMFEDVDVVCAVPCVKGFKHFWHKIYGRQS